MELQEAALAHGCWDESKFVGVQFVTQCWRDRNSLGPLHGHRGADANGVGLPPWPFCLQNTAHSWVNVLPLLFSSNTVSIFSHLQPAFTSYLSQNESCY